MSNLGFQMQDGSIIHLANVEEITLFKYEGVEFIFINNRRILNSKINKKLMKIIFPFVITTGHKVTFTISNVSEEDLTNRYDR